VAVQSALIIFTASLSLFTGLVHPTFPSGSKLKSSPAPMPSAALPWLSLSSVAMKCAVVAGCLLTVSVTAGISFILFVLTAAAPRRASTSQAGFDRKTSDTGWKRWSGIPRTSKPASSAFLTHCRVASTSP
jgi:hypothetical protein